MARIFEMAKDSEWLRQQMRQHIAEGFKLGVERMQARHELPHEVIGRAWDDGVKGAFNDIFRRVIEQGWFGKDIFDGRFHMDNSLGQGREESFSMQGMDTEPYDVRAELYGWDNREAEPEIAPPERGEELEPER